MKKLMFVAVAALAGAAFAKVDKPEAFDPGVYSVTLTEKALVDVLDKKGEPTGKTKVETMTRQAYYFVSESQKSSETRVVVWDAKVQGSYTNTFAKADTTKTVTLSGKTLPADPEAEIAKLESMVGTDVDDVVAGSVVPTFKIDKKAGTTNITKIVYKTISKKNAVKLADGLETSDFYLTGPRTVVKADGKAATALDWEADDEAIIGYGTGTANSVKEKDPETNKTVTKYTTIKTAAGNIVNMGAATSYGTWKVQQDAAATKLYKAGASVEEILAKKKVELVK